MNPVHFSSASVEWSTPQDFYDALDGEFQFTLDAAATDENAKAAHYLTKEQDGLTADWSIYESVRPGPAAVYVNPPYGRGIGAWFAKAHAESLKGCTVVMLVPARTDTAYWHRYVIGTGAEVRFVKGRLKFGGHRNAAPFPSAVVVFRPPTETK